MRALLTNYLENGEEPAHINALRGAPWLSQRELFDELLGLSSSNLKLSEIEEHIPMFCRILVERFPNLELIKTHAALTKIASGAPILPPEFCSRVVYIIRNPLDVAVSFANHSAIGLDKIIERMADSNYGLNSNPGELSPLLPERLSSWSEHVKSWTETKDRDVMLVRYEDLFEEPTLVLTSVLRHYGLSTDERRVRRAVEHSSFETLRLQEQGIGFRERQPSSTTFFRAGRAGSWKTELSSNQVQRIIRKHGNTMRSFDYL